jgi:DNA polymerase-4
VLPLPALARALGDGVAAHLHALANGEDPRAVVPDEPDRSIGAEETFEADVDDHAVIHRELLRLAEKTAARLRASGQAGRTVSLKIRFADFSTVTRARTLPAPTDAARGRRDCPGSTTVRADRPRIRLVGVRVEVSRRRGVGPATELGAGARLAGCATGVDRAVDRFGSAWCARDAGPTHHPKWGAVATPGDRYQRRDPS